MVDTMEMWWASEGSNVRRLTEGAKMAVPASLGISNSHKIEFVGLALAFRFWRNCGTNTTPRELN
jgi:hypothetical protein